MRTCSVAGCKTKGNSKGKSLFSFPKDAKTNKKWVRFVDNTTEGTRRWKKWEQNKNSDVCSDHFISSDFFNKEEFDNSKATRLKLIPNAVPKGKNELLQDKYKIEQKNKSSAKVKKLLFIA